MPCLRHPIVAPSLVSLESHEAGVKRLLSIVGRLALIASMTGGAGLALAQAPSGERVVLAPHRAVYELALDGAKPSKTIERARGRIVFDFTGDACDGYALAFRQVTELVPGEGAPRTIDARTTSFEEGDGGSYRFKTESTSGGAPETVDGTARKSGGGYEVRLTAPKPETFRDATDVMFPNAQMKAIIAAARAGQTTLNVRLYDGANTGKEVYETLAVIGKRLTTSPAEAPLQKPEFEKLARWPVSISYFKAGSGEQTPSYSIAFELYENGMTGAIRLDYGSFALRGTLSRLDPLPASDCRK